MKFLLVLLLACRTAALQHIFGQGGVIGNSQFEIKVSGDWGSASGVLTVSSNVSSNAGEASEGVSKGTAAGVPKGGHDGTGASGGDAKARVGSDAEGEKRGDDSATKAVKRSEREAATSEGAEDESARAKGGDIGGGRKTYFDDDEADSSEAEDDFSEDDESDDVEGGNLRSRVLGIIPKGIGKPYKGIIIGGKTFWYHYEDDGIIKRENERDKHGVLGGLLPSMPRYVSKISTSGHLHGLIDKILHLTDQETGQKFLSVLKPSGEIKDDLFQYLIKCLEPLSAYQVMEVVKYRIQRDRVLAIFASYLESDLYTNHRLELKEERSVEEFLNGTTGSFNIPIRNVYYNHLRAFIRRLFCSCPSQTVEPFGYPTRSVTTLLIKLPISEVGRVMVASVTAKPEFFGFTMILDHLNRWSSINNLNEIRASDKYNKMQKHLSSYVHVGLLDSILRSFFGFDLALIFSVYTIV